MVSAARVKTVVLVIHGVQHIFHPPVRLDRWPDGDRRTRVVFILRDLDPVFVEGLWKAFSGEMALDASWTTVAAGSVATTDESLFNHRVRHVAFTDGTDMKKIVATMSGLIGKLADDIAQTVSPVKAPVRGAK